LILAGGLPSSFVRGDRLLIEVLEHLANHHATLVPDQMKHARDLQVTEALH
jgi:hypothetical protein